MFVNWLKKKVKGPDRDNQNLEKENLVSKHSITEIVFASHSIMGEGPKKTECQDSYIIMDGYKEMYYAFGVFDGHGNSGKEASNASSDNFQKFFDKNVKKIEKLKTKQEREKFILDTYANTEKKLKTSGIDYSSSGTCSIFVFIMNGMLTVSNLGDSRAVLCRVGKEITAIELSWDQKPTRKDEKQRIMNSGGKIERLNYNGEWVGPYRVWADEEGPGIAMTRTLGDFQAKKIGLISRPETDHLVLKRRDKFIVLASDGIWDVMSSAEVVGFILKHEDSWNNDNKIAEMLCNEARSRWEDSNSKSSFSNKIGDLPTAKYGIDDITCIVAFLNFDDDKELKDSYYTATTKKESQIIKKKG